MRSQLPNFDQTATCFTQLGTAQTTRDRDSEVDVQMLGGRAGQIFGEMKRVAEEASKQSWHYVVRDEGEVHGDHHSLLSTTHLYVPGTRVILHR